MESDYKDAGVSDNLITISKDEMATMSQSCKAGYFILNRIWKYGSAPAKENGGVIRVAMDTDRLYIVLGRISRSKRTQLVA